MHGAHHPGPDARFWPEVPRRRSPSSSPGRQEDDQVFIVSPTGANQWNHGACGYGPGPPDYIPEGTPEWGQTHFAMFERVRLGSTGAQMQDDPHWIASHSCPLLGSPTPCVKYRTCCTANVWWMGNLFSRLIHDQVAPLGGSLPTAYLYRPEFYHYAVRYYSLMTGQYSWFVQTQGNETTFFELDLFEKTWNRYDDNYAIPSLPSATLPLPRCPAN